MKIIISIIIVLTVSFLPAAGRALEESDVPIEEYKGTIPKNELTPENYTTFRGYINSKDITMAAGVMSVVYHLCKENLNEICSDEQGVIIISGADTGKIVNTIKTLDDAYDNKLPIEIILSAKPYFAGARRIIDVKVLNFNT